MKLTRFDIRNFKGIAHTTIQLADDIPGNVGTLIGLNESGKTTILEALSYFITEDKDTAELVGTVTKKSPLQDIIPKDRKAAFTGSITIEAYAVLSQADVDNLADYLLSKHHLILDKENTIREFTVKTTFDFEDSTYKRSQNLWSFLPYLRKRTQRNFVRYNATDEALRPIWLSAIQFLRERLPKIVYFPTFLFDFPDRIYLTGDTTDINDYYVQVIQDVLDSQGEGLTIQKHIIDRIKNAQTEHPAVATFFAFFFQRDEKKQIDAVLQKASSKMSEVIFGSWNQILGRNVTGKRVQIEWLLDGEKANAPYLEVSIVDGESKYSLSERSLGFRWFFSFLLFTQFRRNRKTDSSTLFLFDEPAANLHSKAQIKLLETFSKIANGPTYIIYSTHSHYMVNPLWLEKAYIVQNKATDYDREDDVDSFAVRKTDIIATRYRTFVGTYPMKTTYFQPVLDALEVAFSPLVRSSNALIVEGKNDFYPLMYFRRKLTASTMPEIFPGNGAGDASCLIRLFRGWGVRFRLLLDDDKAGRQAKKKYIDELLLNPIEVATLGDISKQLKGKKFEGIYQEDVRNAVKSSYSTAKPTKKQFALHFQELLASKNEVSYPETEAIIKIVSEWIDKQFDTAES